MKQIRGTLRLIQFRINHLNLILAYINHKIYKEAIAPVYIVCPCPMYIKVMLSTAVETQVAAMAQ